MEGLKLHNQVLAEYTGVEKGRINLESRNDYIKFIAQNDTLSAMYLDNENEVFELGKHYIKNYNIKGYGKKVIKIG